MHTQKLNNLKTLHRALKNAIAKPDANAELGRNWLSKEQLPPAKVLSDQGQVQVRNVLIRRWRVVPAHLVAGYMQALSPVCMHSSYLS